MAYIPFYNKYRPQKFEEVVGQEPVITTLKNSIKDNKISHAYLFCGPRGTGKTTMARIFAKALNCEKGLGMQCNECSNCKSITRGDHPDVIEIDAASNSSVESVRDLIENVSYNPIKSKYKIYIIDEVHNMSNAAFNALLKTLEEPPEFVIFILATTEPQKIIPTILSRVQRFDFEKINQNLLIKNMENILKKENVNYDIDALKIIANLSDGGVRDSLSLLDQVVSYSGSKITVNDVNKLFGLMSIEEEIKVVDYIEKKDYENLLSLIKNKYESGIDIVRFHQDLIDIYLDLLKYRVTSNSSYLEKVDNITASNIPISNTKLSYYIDELVKSKREYKNTDNLLSHLQISLIKLIDQQTQNTNPIISKVVEQKLITEPEEVKSKVHNNVFSSKTKIDEKISYTHNDILAIMSIGISSENAAKRKELFNNWSNLKNDTSNEYLSSLLHQTVLRVCANNILLVTDKLSDTIDTLQKVDNQSLIKTIFKNTFGEEYNLLCITEVEFSNMYTLFKNKKQSGDNISETINISFDKLSKRDEFVKDIFDN